METHIICIHCNNICFFFLDAFGDPKFPILICIFYRGSGKKKAYESQEMTLEVPRAANFFFF